MNTVGQIHKLHFVICFVVLQNVLQSVINKLRAVYTSALPTLMCAEYVAPTAESLYT